MPGEQQPPICAGAMLPVARTRRISVAAAVALTSKRCAAARAELPASTARTSRCRRSAESGAVIVVSRLLLTQPPRTTNALS